MKYWKLSVALVCPLRLIAELVMTHPESQSSEWATGLPERFE
jgi:hypothetical protein